MAKKSKRTDEDEAPRRSKSSSKGSGTIKIDMREAKSGGGRVRLPEGDYKVKITKVSKGMTKDGDKSKIIVTYEILEGVSDKVKGKSLTDHMVITPKSAYRVGQLLDACGVKWSAKVIELPLDKLKGKTLGITVHDGDPYNNRVTSEIGDWLDEDTIDGILEGGPDEEEDDDEDDDDDDDEDEDEDEDEDLENFDEDDEL
jgi:hypothetical protein